jgi:hypothetical protein
MDFSELFEQNPGMLGEFHKVTSVLSQKVVLYVASDRQGADLYEIVRVTFPMDYYKAFFLPDLHEWLQEQVRSVLHYHNIQPVEIKIWSFGEPWMSSPDTGSIDIAITAKLVERPVRQSNTCFVSTFLKSLFKGGVMEKLPKP